MHTTDAELVYIDGDLRLVCLNAETNTSHVLLDKWSLVRQNKTKIFLDKQKYFFELQELRYTCHCCNHFILMCIVSTLQAQYSPAQDLLEVAAAFLHQICILPTLARP